MDGILLVDKPKGWTSFDVVAKTRNCIRSHTGQKKPKVGHTGTLDPLATGLLVLVVGSYCKQASRYSKLDKAYEAVIRLGETSTTADAEGEKTRVSAYEPSTKEIKAAIAAFVGDITQIPPSHSAKKIGGQRAYKLARSGKPVEMQPQQVTVYQAELTAYAYPLLTCTFQVSSGTYIRTLATDIGDRLQTGAYLADLRRTEVGSFHVANAVGVEALCEDPAAYITQPSIDN